MSSIVDISELLLELGLSGTVTEEERAIAQTSLTKAEGAIKRFLKYDPVQRVRTEYYPQFDFSQKNRRGVWEADDNQAFIRRLSEAASDELQVHHMPIRETDADGNNAIDLRVDFDARSGTRPNSFGADTVREEGTEFWPNYDSQDSNGIRICKDGIIRSIGRWPSVAQSVKIVYVAGYSTSELHGQDSLIDASPILESVLDEAQRRFLKAHSRFKKSKAGFTGPFKSEKLGDYAYSLDTDILAKLVGGSFDILPETREKLNDFIPYHLGVM